VAGAGADAGRLLGDRGGELAGPVALLGQPEEQVLERRERGCEREDADAGAAQGQRQGADGALVGLEAEAVLLGERMLDARLLARHLQRARVIGAAQPVAGAPLAAQVREGALVDDPSGVDDRHAVAQILHLRELVTGEQHRDPVVGEAADQQAHVAHAGRIEPRRGLVEDQQARAAQQGGRDPQALAHPVGVAADPVSRPRSELDDRKDLIDALLGAGAVERREQFEVLAAGEVGVEAGSLHEPGDALQRARALAQRVATEQLDSALGGRDQAERHAKGCRLAGSVRAEEAVDVARVDVQVDVIDGDYFVVALDQATCPDGRPVVGHVRGLVRRPRWRRGSRSRRAGSAHRSARS
jgi:hypothetical protein